MHKISVMVLTRKIKCRKQIPQREGCPIQAKALQPKPELKFLQNQAPITF